MGVKSKQLRDHQSVVIEEFNGLWERGGSEAVPIDHFDGCNNIAYIEAGFRTRDGVDTFIPGVDNIVRMYNYKQQGGESLLVLDSGGNLFHVLLDGSESVLGPILSISTMQDFGFTSIAGNAYINPFETFIDNTGTNRQRGIENQFLYVYLGDGNNARKAAGDPPTGSAMVVVQGPAGFADLGFHLYAVVYETDTGFLTAPGPELFTGFDTVSTVNGISISNVPVSSDSFVVARHIIATKKILNYNGDQDGFQFFFVPEGKIDDNTTTSIDVDFFDLDLLDDASHLIDNFSEIPAGVGLTTYNSRLVTSCFFSDLSLVRLSHPGEPEAISEVDGLIIVPLDGLPLTEVQEYRDVLYMFKQTRTWATTDNGDVPATWSGPTVIDQGIGAPVHGVIEVLDSGGVNVEMLLINDFTGLMMFNGSYGQTPLSWKIEDRWRALNRNLFHFIQAQNDTIFEVLYIVMPDRTMLIADYSRGMDPKNIRWSPWTFDVEINTLALIETNKLILGSQEPFVGP